MSPSHALLGSCLAESETSGRIYTSNNTTPPEHSIDLTRSQLDSPPPLVSPTRDLKPTHRACRPPPAPHRPPPAPCRPLGRHLPCPTTCRQGREAGQQVGGERPVVGPRAVGLGLLLLVLARVPAPPLRPSRCIAPSQTPTHTTTDRPPQAPPAVPCAPLHGRFHVSGSGLQGSESQQRDFASPHSGRGPRPATATATARAGGHPDGPAARGRVQVSVFGRQRLHRGPPLPSHPLAPPRCPQPLTRRAHPHASI